MPVALLTGASRGLGHALAQHLAALGWDLILDAREPLALQARSPASATLVPGDVSDPAHRADLLRATRSFGRLDLLVNNASILGPMPPLGQLPLDALRQVFEVNVLAPLALTQALLPLLDGGTVLNVSSDAGVEAYAGWGGYGSSKAALDQLTAVLAVEVPGVRFIALDPGDMRTQLHQEAFPGEDISDRPLPETVVPAVLRCLDLPSGRYRASDLLAAVTA